MRSLTLPQSFGVFSKGHSLAYSHLGTAMRLGGMLPTEEYIACFASEKRITLEAFSAFRPPKPSMDLHEALAYFDTDRTGSISLSNMCFAVQGVAERLLDNEVDETITAARDNCSSSEGFLCIGELVKELTS